MFHRKTLFVVGAGASKEFGLPIGAKLAESIRTKMDIKFETGNRHVGEGDIDLFHSLTSNMTKDVRGLHDAAWLIRDGIGLARSIDDFIDAHHDNPFVVQYGKAAIVRTILEAERESKLYFKPHEEQFSTAPIADTWLVKLMQALLPGNRKEKLDGIFENIKFVVFNYDRCIEHFLLNALQKAYGLRDDDAFQLRGKLTILHPYGMIHGDTPFGSSRGNYPALSKGISTYTEQIGPGGMRLAINDVLTEADTIVFLGFAFHETNMALLAPPKPFAKRKRIYGTALGMSESDVQVTKHEIDSWFEKEGRTLNMRLEAIGLEDKLTCVQLFDHYAKSLTAK
jgi:hypothetical protein